MANRSHLLAQSSLIAVMSLTAPTLLHADGPMPVVATFSILGDMLAQIGGDHIALTTLVGADGDPHVYQPTPQAARKVSEAEVLILNGLEFEGWLERLVQASGFDGTLVVATDGIDAIAYKDGDEHEDHDEHGDENAEHEDHEGEHKDSDEHGDHDHGVFDPHAWQDISLAVTYADNIAAGLAKADPENAGAYYANRASYVAEIEALSVEISAMMAAIPEENRTIVASHDAFGYFAAAYDLKIVAPQGLSTESEPSAADIAALITQIREDNISAVFLGSIADNRVLEQIASETGATIGGTLYAGSLSKEDGPAATYLEMIRRNATTLAKALGS